MTGSRAASGGKSHSCVTAASRSPRPSANTISVALGSREQIVAGSPPPLTASESVQRFRVLAEDAARGPGRNAREVVGDRLLRFGPRAVWMRVIRRPHDAVLSEEVDHAQADMISLKRRPDLSADVAAGRHRQMESAMRAPILFRVQELPIRVVHPLEQVGQPPNAGLREDDLERGEPLTRPRKDHGSQWLVHLERGTGNPDPDVARRRRLWATVDGRAKPPAQVKANR